MSKLPNIRYFIADSYDNVIRRCVTLAEARLHVRKIFASYPDHRFLIIRNAKTKMPVETSNTLCPRERIIMRNLATDQFDVQRYAGLDPVYGKPVYEIESTGHPSFAAAYETFKS